MTVRIVAGYAKPAPVLRANCNLFSATLYKEPRETTLKVLAASLFLPTCRDRLEILSFRIVFSFFVCKTDSPLDCTFLQCVQLHEVSLETCFFFSTPVGLLSDFALVSPSGSGIVTVSLSLARSKTGQEQGRVIKDLQPISPAASVKFIVYHVLVSDGCCRW
jgi:hypothetical protein